MCVRLTVCVAGLSLALAAPAAAQIGGRIGKIGDSDQPDVILVERAPCEKFILHNGTTHIETVILDFIQAI